jgi:hypothetical protein
LQKRNSQRGSLTNHSIKISAEPLFRKQKNALISKINAERPYSSGSVSEGPVSVSNPGLLFAIVEHAVPSIMVQMEIVEQTSFGNGIAGTSMVGSNLPFLIATDFHHKPSIRALSLGEK